MKNGFLIYCESTTTRLNYILSFFFKDLYGLTYELTADLSYFEQSEVPKLVYFKEKIKSNSPYLIAHSLLFEKEIKETTIDIFNYKGSRAFFACDENSILPFDIFAASFYLLSRYEEYLPFSVDKFGRFPASESIASKFDFLEEPIIDTWSMFLEKNLLAHYPGLQFKKRNFRFLPTIDIDNAYAHLHKGIVRTLLSMIQTSLKKPVHLVEKIKVLVGQVNDPYDNYEFLNKMHEKYGLSPIYFILFSKYGKYDKNLSTKSTHFQKLIRSISDSHSIGLHPSFQSNKNTDTLKSEKKELEIILKKRIEQSRQHFLMLNLPKTYENLIEIGIKKDYSMGYASKPGFRAGTCTPFYFFNLQTNQTTDLKVTPFAVMDVCFSDYLKYSPTEALKKIKKILTSTKKVNGLFVSLWHNESLGSKNQHFTWQHVYEEMLHEAKK